MHQFTDKDIATIKQTTEQFIAAICGGSALLDLYVEDKTLTKEQAVDMIAYIKANYSKINYCPLPKELQPLIDIAQRRVKETAAIKARIRKTPTRWSDGYSYTSSYFASDSVWGDGYQ